MLVFPLLGKVLLGEEIMVSSFPTITPQNAHRLAKEAEGVVSKSMSLEERQQQLTTALSQVLLPSGIEIRPWSAADFPVIQQLSQALGWPSPTQRPADPSLIDRERRHAER